MITSGVIITALICAAAVSIVKLLSKPGGK